MTTIAPPSVWTCPEPDCGFGLIGAFTSLDVLDHMEDEHSGTATSTIHVDLSGGVAVETVAQQIKRTGLHPITQGAPRRPGRHAAPWTPARAYEDAHQALECYQPTGRRRATEYIGTAYPLQPHEAEAAVWTKGVLQ